MSERQPSGFACSSCGKDFSEHLGLVGTCQQVQQQAARIAELESELKALEAACDREREQRKSVVRVNEWQSQHIGELEALLRECGGELSLDLDSDHPLRQRIRKALETK